MSQKVKTKKCRHCRKEYSPITEWQKFCSPHCRDFINNKKRAKTIKAMRKFFEAHSTPQVQQ